MNRNTKILDFLAWLWKKSLGEDLIVNKSLLDCFSYINEEHCKFLNQLENNYPEIKDIIKKHQEKRSIAACGHKNNRKGVKLLIESCLAWLWEKLLKENPSRISDDVQILMKLNREHYSFYEEFKNNYPELKFIVQRHENKILLNLVNKEKDRICPQ
jgi:hypothetical protein